MLEKKKKKKERTTKFDKNNVKCNVKTVQCEDRIIKCEKKIRKPPNVTIAVTYPKKEGYSRIIGCDNIKLY